MTIGVAARKRALESDTRLARIDAGLAATPLVDENSFAVANYNPNSVVFEATTSKRLFVILATLMGGLIAVVFVLFRDALRYRENQSPNEAIK